MNLVSFIMISFGRLFISHDGNFVIEKKGANDDESLEFDEYGNPIYREIHSETFIDGSIGKSTITIK
jgi:hypothetical protein